jgi:polyisoprenoid-binding protein YceI
MTTFDYTVTRLRAGTLLALMISIPATIAHAAQPAAPPPMPAPSVPPAGNYHLEKSHASLIMRVNHMGFSNYTTRFSRFDSELNFDPARPDESTVSATIDADSFEMDGAPAMCLDIMKGEQMLDTKKFPQILFKSQRVRMTGPKAMEITGAFTLHGVTRPLVLRGTYNGGYAGMPNMDPQARIGFSAHGQFKRSDFGIAFGVPAPGTTMGVGDLVDFSIEAEFAGPPLAAAAGSAGTAKAPH